MASLPAVVVLALLVVAFGWLGWQRLFCWHCWHSVVHVLVDILLGVAFGLELHCLWKVHLRKGSVGFTEEVFETMLGGVEGFWVCVVGLKWSSWGVAEEHEWL